MKVITPEQEALIPAYREKWQEIAFSTEPINRPKAEAAVQRAYELMWKKAPRIIFCRSPYEAMSLKLESEENIFNQMLTNLGEMLSSQVAEIWGEPPNTHPRDLADAEVNFAEIFFEQIGWIWQGIEGLQKQETNPLSVLQGELEKSALEEVRNLVNNRLPKERQYEEIAAEFGQIYSDLLNEINRQNIPEIDIAEINWPTSKESWREIIAKFERQMWWLPKPLLQWWLEGMLVILAFNQC